MVHTINDMICNTITHTSPTISIIFKRNLLCHTKRLEIDHKNNLISKATYILPNARWKFKYICTMNNAKFYLGNLNVHNENVGNW